MSYLLDRKIKRKKILYALAFIFVCFVLFYFRLGIWNSLSYLSHGFFRPFLTTGNNIGGKLGSFSSYFLSKNSLYLENENLKSKLSEQEARNSNYNSILAENVLLKETLGRKKEQTIMTLSAILSKPNKSPYDTLVIDVGIRQGIKIGDMVFALGNVPIGSIAEAHLDSSKVVLFSNSGEKIQVLVNEKSASFSEANNNIFLEIVGRGGGNFEMILPRDFKPLKGDEVILPGIVPYVVGIIETIISDPRDPFVKALLVSPVNIQELKFVEVKQ
ncbi:MAG: rod shape-determining protein MreC [Candidatus Paceibacterota bacterium]|jgi:cell shape-determining protein MreC